MRRALRAALGFAWLAAGIAPEVRSARAQDASFGCKVLLCAAATAPGWSGIPYCVPVMQSLFRQLARGGSWPVCSEGNAGSVGYDPYLPCPAGTTAVAGGSADGQTYVPSPSGGMCADLTKPRQSCATSDAACAPTDQALPRATRPDPNYVDIQTANGPQRFYFSLGAD